MMLLGLIWAMAAPLLLLIPIVILAFLLSLTGWSFNLRITVSAVIVFAVTGTIWWFDYREFVSVCESTGKPRIMSRSTADGIYLDSPTANSFGMNYLHLQGFSWIEMRSIYDRNRIERVTRDSSGQIKTEPAETISARYEVRETFEQPYPHTGLSMTRIIDRQTGALMAQAGSAHFNGGRAHWFSGAYGTRSFPSAMSHSNDFQNYYYLAQRTLGRSAK